MVKKTLTYKDFDGNERTEDFYFNLLPKELMDLQTSMKGGLSQMLDKIIKENDQNALYKYFEQLVLVAYGVKSMDGRTMDKSDAAKEDFKSTVAYSDIYMDLATDAKAATDFVNGILPSKEEMEKYTKRVQAAAENNISVSK
ncbi:MAG: hypothetical protein J6U54_17930 [Clostridiales bacterium]|nr:hypothetical protein [Clostridiales bacterium]